ncbi:MAG: hypothetical protein FJ029_13825, partial [Actinobacteria bacterium]|nr:hypothetical protein [Actinomycetota bacterium]
MRRAWLRVPRAQAIPAGIVTIVVVLFLNNLAGASIRPLLPVYLEKELGLPP